MALDDVRISAHEGLRHRGISSTKLSMVRVGVAMGLHVSPPKAHVFMKRPFQICCMLLRMNALLLVVLL